MSNDLNGDGLFGSPIRFCFLLGQLWEVKWLFPWKDNLILYCPINFIKKGISKKNISNKDYAMHYINIPGTSTREKTTSDRRAQLFIKKCFLNKKTKRTL